MKLLQICSGLLAGTFFTCAHAGMVASSNTTGLVSYWNMDGDAVDSAGGRFSNNAGGTFSSGVFGDAITLNGSNQFVDLGANTNTFFSDGTPFTIGLWFNADAPGASSLFSFDDDTGAFNRTVIYTDSTGVRAGYRNVHGDSPGVLLGHDIDYVESWVHVAVTADPTIASLRLYVNGSEVDFGTGTPNSSPGALSIDSGAIGRYHINPSSAFIDDLQPPLTGHGSYFAGSIDDVAVWNRELSAGEIAAIGSVTSPVPEPTSIAMWSVLGGVAMVARRRRQIRQTD